MTIFRRMLIFYDPKEKVTIIRFIYDKVKIREVKKNRCGIKQK